MFTKPDILSVQQRWSQQSAGAIDRPGMHLWVSTNTNSTQWRVMHRARNKVYRLIPMVSHRAWRYAIYTLHDRISHWCMFTVKDNIRPMSHSIIRSVRRVAWCLLHPSLADLSTTSRVFLLSSSLYSHITRKTSVLLTQSSYKSSVPAVKTIFIYLFIYLFTYIFMCLFRC